MSQSLIVQIAGLFTNANLLSAARPGALSVADNVVISKTNLAESRRGFAQLQFGLPLTTDRADKLFEYQGTVLAHYDTSKLGYYDSALGVQPYSGTFNHPDPMSAKIRSAEANSNFYFTSAAGIQKLDAYTGVPTLAGMYAGLDCTATLVQAQVLGTITSNAVAITSHCYTTGLVGQVTNSGGTLPTGLSASTNYYVIRVSENSLKFASSYANALAGTFLTISGGTGTNTFTPTMVSNATSFLGQAQVGYRILWGITDANNNLVVGSPSYQTVVTNATTFNQNVSIQITIPAGITTAYFFQVYRSSQSSGTTVLPLDDGQLVYEGSPSSADITALSTRVIDIVPDSLRGAKLYTNEDQQGILQSNALPPYAEDVTVFRNCLFFANTQSVQLMPLSVLSVSGSNGIQIGDTLTLAGNTFTAVSSTPAANTNNFQVITSGSIAQNINSTAINLVRTINQSTTNTGIYAYYTSTVSGLPGQILIQNRSLGGSIFYATASNGSTAFSPALPPSGTTVASTNSVNLNGLMYSKQQIPDAVPTDNILYPGSASKKILRILALRSSLFILKEDGIYRCTGNDPTTFTIDLVDNTATLISPESAVTLDNQIYALTTQGVVAISDTGVQIMSEDIQNTLTDLYASAPDEVTAYGFGVGYESERTYIVWLPSEEGDTAANQAYAYNYLTKAWTRWTREQQHALVLSADGKIYAADPNSSYIDQERKNGDYTDYSDEAYACVVEGYNQLTLTLNDVENAGIGDLVYMSGSQSSIITGINVGANQVTVTDLVEWNAIQNFTSSNVSTGASTITITDHGYAAAQLITLTTTGSLPGGLVVGTSYYVIVVDANTIQLATSAANAESSTYIPLTTVGSSSSSVVPTSFILKSIACTVEWVPNAAQNAGLLKQWTEAVVLLRENFFNTATVNFYSDVDGSIEGQVFSGITTGGWGQFPWGLAPWGQASRSLPFRTYVPRNKQRCDLLSVQFVCQNAWARFQLEGISLSVRGYSTRVGM